MRVPFYDLTRQYIKLKPYLDDAVGIVMKSGIFLFGKHGRNFEQRFSAYIGTRHAVGVGSGTDALMIALRAIGIQSGDEVIVPANAYPTAFGVALTGARIRLIDCGNDGTLDVKQLERTVSKKTKALVAVHLYGNPVNLLYMNRFMLSKKQKVFLIEDCAQAHGAEIKVKSQEFLRKDSGQARVKSEGVEMTGMSGSQKQSMNVWKKVGSIGDIGCFSFYPTKNLGAYGDGGMITTNNEAIALRLRALRMYGETKRYESQEISGVSRLDEIQAGILRIKLRFLDTWNKRREMIARHYLKELNGVGDLQFLTPDSGNQYIKPVHHLFVIRTNYRDQLQIYLIKKGIGTSIHYPIPIHLTKAFSSLGYSQGDFPVSEAMSREILSLPIFPELTDNEVEYVTRTIRIFYAKAKPNDAI